MEIIRERTDHRDVSYSLGFRERNAFGWCGYAFDCDEGGSVDITALNPAARENLEKCLNGTYDVEPEGVRKTVHQWTEPGAGLCEVCGEEVILDGFTCTCSCGADYNSSGQRLAPREQWGEETGETIGEILRSKELS